MISKLVLLTTGLLAVGHFSQVAMAECTNAGLVSPSGICPAWSDVRDYSIPAGCNALYRSIECGMSSALNGIVPWNAETIYALCISCSPFTRFVYNTLESSTDSGCMFMRESLNALCSMKTNDFATFSSCGTESFLTGLVGYLGGDDTGIEQTCGEISCCHTGELKTLDYYFDIDDTTNLEVAISVLLPDVALTPTDVCEYVLNETSTPTSQNDYCATTFLNAAVLEAYPYEIVAGNDVTSCFASDALSPAADNDDTPTCASWADIIDLTEIQKAVDEDCLDLIYRARCNMDSLAARADGFFLLSDLDLMCRGKCASFTKYVVEKLEAASVEDEPGCTFLKKFLDGLCTENTYLGSEATICYERGSAFLTAMTIAASDPVLGQRAFFSACAAYSCCEDYAFTTLPYYFQFTESLLELGIGARLPTAYAAGTIDSEAICAEFNLTAYTRPLGDTCTSSFALIDTWDPDSAIVSTLSISAVISFIVMLAFL